jgi:ABC-2 type transport system ATP-binding protein
MVVGNPMVDYAAQLYASGSSDDAVVIQDLVKDYTVPASRAPKDLLGRLRNMLAPAQTTKRALCRINLTVPRGQVLGFIGPNGAGKTTTVKVLCGILTPTSGHVEVLGFEPHKQRYRYTYHIGLVFGQRSLLWYDIPVIESLRLYADIYEISKDALQRKIERFSDLLDIGDLLHIPVRKLSLGQRMRAEIAASLLHDPEILFLDEPTLGLDAVAKERIRGFLKQLNEEQGTTIFLTTHDMNDIEALCDRVVIIDKGAIIYDGSVESLRTADREKVLEVQLRPGGHGGENGTKTLSLLRTYAEEPVTEASMRLRFRVPQERSLEVISELLALDTVQDLNVQPPSLDSVIRRIYEGSVSVHDR